MNPIHQIMLAVLGICIFVILLGVCKIIVAMIKISKRRSDLSVDIYQLTEIRSKSEIRNLKSETNPKYQNPKPETGSSKQVHQGDETDGKQEQ